ncbi:hypothetical protein EDE15_4764 [Edaphobacter aggregans]|uniref:Uncharacterized protein n=1 Tax=Edaphobacter aggregans TaxID=570835 RepID=A0A3R9PW23_9BACT|nr:hypothetical protein EDE15_4764 [Edaphobacter aggregans]
MISRHLVQLPRLIVRRILLILGFRIGGFMSNWTGSVNTGGLIINNVLLRLEGLTE